MLPFTLAGRDDLVTSDSRWPLSSISILLQACGSGVGRGLSEISRPAELRPAPPLRGHLLNLLLAREEDEDVARRLAEVDLDRGADGGLEVVALRLLRVEDLHREGAAGHVDSRAVVEVLLELAGVERRAHDDQPHVRPLPIAAVGDRCADRTGANELCSRSIRQGRNLCQAWLSGI